MKIVIALAMLVSSIAFSEVKRAGTFVPSMCSTSEEHHVTMCIGTRVRMVGSFISVDYYRARAFDVYEIVERKAGNGGFNPLFKLEHLLLDDGNETVKAERRWNNDADSEHYVLRFSDGRVMLFMDFRPVYTTL